MRMRYAGKSLLATIDVIDTTQENRIVAADTNKELTILKVVTEYFSQPTLDYYYEKLEQNNNDRNLSIPQTIDSYLYYF